MNHHSYPPISSRFPHFFHGGDYNPDQWPEVVWLEDMRLMKLANCQVMSVGIFAWTKLEPEEGHFEFGWLDRVLDLMAKNEIYAILATPSGARPAWLSQKYPEVLRVRPERLRHLHGERHNHCLTSTVYREKTALINCKLAERYGHHPALLMWHISNEYSGECHCELCQEAFRTWLKERYDHDLERLNQAWWTAFWSHTYTDWSQLESPSPIGEQYLHGLKLDWNRFVTDQTISFFQNEIAPLRELTPTVPVTTNLMGFYSGINYQKLARELDVVSWDSYPVWHSMDSDADVAMRTAFTHDVTRSFKDGQPFMLMESTPSITNWHAVPRLKRPGMHRLSSLQAVAHGSDTVQYFQWRKSRGSAEKYHGAVVDHVGHEYTRVFKEVAELGADLQKLDDVIGAAVPAEAAVLYDWEVGWTIEEMQALGNDRERRGYWETALSFYAPLWKRGIPTDVISQDADFGRYRLIVAPMLHMLRPGVASRLKDFVAKGGTLVMTYWSGQVNESDLCFLGGWPGDGLSELFGIWDEETDTLMPGDCNHIVMAAGNELGLPGSYEVKDYCALIHAPGASVLATFASDFYQGRPALTINHYGSGQAYYVAARSEHDFNDALLDKLILQQGLEPAIAADLPAGVSTSVRVKGEKIYRFVMNFNPYRVTLDLGKHVYHSILSGQEVHGELVLPVYGVDILE